MKKITITKGDLDKAVDVPWSVTTCIIAQTVIRNGVPIQGGDGAWIIVDNSEQARQAMHIFDRARGVQCCNQEPDWNMLAMLRAMLPIRVALP